MDRMREEKSKAGVVREAKVQSLGIMVNVGRALLNFRGKLIECFGKVANSVYAIAPDINDHEASVLMKMNARAVRHQFSRTGVNPITDVFDTVRLYRVLKRLQLDVFFSCSAKPVIFGSIAAYFAGVKERYALINGLGYAFTCASERRVLHRRVTRFFMLNLFRVALRLNKKVFFQNRDDMEELISRGAVTRERAFQVNGTGVDLRYYEQRPLPSPGSVTFLMAARLIEEKGVREFIEAAKMIKGLRSDTRFILLGGAEISPTALNVSEIERRVEEGVVEWPGRVPDIRPWLEETSVYVLPSYYREGVPRSIQEAMAMGRPIITTNLPGCKETVVNGENGFFIEAKNVKSLSEAMLRFVENPEFIRTMGAKSRNLAEERFDVNEVNRIILREMGLSK